MPLIETCEICNVLGGHNSTCPIQLRERIANLEDMVAVLYRHYLLTANPRIGLNPPVSESSKECLCTGGDVDLDCPTHGQKVRESTCKCAFGVLVGDCPTHGYLVPPSG